ILASSRPVLVPYIIIICCLPYFASSSYSLSFFFNDPATTQIYTFPYTTLFRSAGRRRDRLSARPRSAGPAAGPRSPLVRRRGARSEEHTSELQSRSDLVCRLLLEKKKNTRIMCTLAIESIRETTLYS